MTKIRLIYILYIIVVNCISTFAQNGCNPGDTNGNSGCPDPNGNCSTTSSGNSLGISIRVLTAIDPNEIIGPAGYDNLKWVSGKQALQYKVLFENDPDFASGPAQNIRIELPIHAKFNTSAFRVGDFGFRNLDFSVPPNTTIYTKRLDVRDSLGVYVDVTAGLDVVNRKAFWVFQAIDPLTGLSTNIDPLKGILPVNDSLSHNGEGYVTFTIIPVSTVQTKDSVTAQASIVFDTEETIQTNTWLNIIDAGLPFSNVASVAAIGANTARITWTGQDDANGVGIDYYDLYVSQDNGPFRLYQSRINATSYDFIGPSGSTYKFFTIATDLVGNIEALKTTATNSIFLGEACNTSDLIVTEITVTKYTPDKIYYTAIIKNVGSTPVNKESFLLGIYTSSDDLVNGNDVFKYSISPGTGTLAPNQTSSFSHWTNFSFSDSQYYLRIKADETGSINECNEVNNDLFKLVNKCTSVGNLNLTGNIPPGLYATNQAVNISNAVLDNFVLIVGKTIVGTPTITAVNSAFVIGGCLNSN